MDIFNKEFNPYLRAGFPVLAVETCEEQRLARMATTGTYQDKDGVMTPYVVMRITIQFMMQRVEITEGELVYTDIGKMPEGYVGAFAAAVREGNWLLLVHDWQSMMKQPKAYRDLKESLAGLKSTYSRILLVGPSWVGLPDEIKHDVKIVKMPLPERDGLAAALDTILSSTGILLEESIYDAVLSAAKGLTLSQAEDAIALALVKLGHIDPSVVADVKMDQVRQSGLVDISNPVPVEDVGGLAGWKEFVEQEIIPAMGTPLSVKRVLLVGLPGCLHGDTPIYDPIDGTTKTVAERERAGGEFNVIALGTGGPIIATAMPPHNYGPADMIEFTLGNGKTITVTPAHRFWAGVDYTCASEIYIWIQKYGSYWFQTNWSGHGQTVEIVSARQVGTHNYYDFHVPNYNNYWAVDMFHHNTGKSLSSKALGAYLQIPVLECPFSKLKGSLVGDSEKNISAMLNLVNAVTPVVAWFDEIDDAFGDAESSARTGSTTGSMVGIFATWLEEKQKQDTIVVATANDFFKIPTKIVRRFDEIFFVDLPSTQERKEIAAVHLRLNGNTATSALCDLLANLSRDWTGDEIRKCILSAARRTRGNITAESLKDAASSVKPIAITRAEEIAALRKWGHDTVRIANTPEVSITSKQSARRIQQTVST